MSTAVENRRLSLLGPGLREPFRFFSTYFHFPVKPVLNAFDFLSRASSRTWPATCFQGLRRPWILGLQGAGVDAWSSLEMSWARGLPGWTPKPAWSYRTGPGTTAWGAAGEVLPAMMVRILKRRKGSSPWLSPSETEGPRCQGKVTQVLTIWMQKRARPISGPSLMK